MSYFPASETLFTVMIAGSISIAVIAAVVLLVMIVKDWVKGTLW